MKRRPVKERLIETASNLFYQNGYNRTGINEILEKSGVAKASMYQHFRSKEEIGVEYLRHMDAQSKIALQERVEASPEGKAKLMAVLDHVEGFFDSGSFRGCWSLNTIAEISQDDEMMMEEILKQKKDIKAYIFSLVCKNADTDSPKELADQLYLLFESALMESRVFNNKWPIDSAKAVLSKLLEKS